MKIIKEHGANQNGVKITMQHTILMFNEYVVIVNVVKKDMMMSN